jgi:hypothetical protein
MTTTPPDKLMIVDYCGTLSLEAPRFGRPENLIRVLAESGLAALGVSTPEVFWGTIVDPTWVEGSTTSIGFAQVMAERIESLGLAPDVPASKIEAATARFVATYLASSRIDPRWRSLLSRLNENPAVMTVVATDHYAEATGKITSYLESWGIHARKIAKGEDLASPPASSEVFVQLENRIPEARIGDFSGSPASAAQRLNGKLGTAPYFFMRNRELSPFSVGEEVQGRKMSSARRDRDFQRSPRFLVANSADLGVWKADPRFWKILKSQLPLASVRRILLIDDFGFNEAQGDSYGEPANVLARREKTVANLRETFEAVLEVAPFDLPVEDRECEEAGARLIEETAARVDAFLTAS